MDGRRRSRRRSDDGMIMRWRRGSKRRLKKKKKTGRLSKEVRVKDRILGRNLVYIFFFHSLGEYFIISN